MAAAAALSSSSSSESESSESEAEEGVGDSEPESDVEGTPLVQAPLLGSAPVPLAAVIAAAPPPLPPPLAFSRDAAERLWREQHLVGGSEGGEEGQEDVTGLALDLLLLSVMCSGNDYLPAIQVGVLLRQWCC